MTDTTIADSSIAIAEGKPAHYSQLDAAETTAWDLLEKGAASAKEPFHTPVLATVTPDGAPCARTIVLREACRKQRILRANTDNRSLKARDLAHDSRAQLHFYEPEVKIQLRATVKAELLTRGDIHAEAWRTSDPGSKVCYLAVDAPGAPQQEPISGLPDFADHGQRVTADLLETGLENFAIMRFHVESLDWLYLDSKGHRRARFDYVADTSSWVIP